LNDRTIRWGILGTGNIAAEFARGLRDCPHAQLIAVGSRSIEKSRSFGQQFGIPHCYGNYERLVENPAVDVSYIATPHSLHRDNMSLALQAGKAVLCEKPLAINEEQAREAGALWGLRYRMKSRRGILASRQPSPAQVRTLL